MFGGYLSSCFSLGLANAQIKRNFTGSNKVLTNLSALGSYGFDSKRSGWGKHAVRWIIST